MLIKQAEERVKNAQDELETRKAEKTNIVNKAKEKHANRNKTNESLRKRPKRIKESFWQPGPEFEEYLDLYNKYDDSGWNNWNNEQRDRFCTKLAKEYLRINPYPSQDFFDDLTDNNFHSDYKAFRKLLGESYRRNRKSKRMTEAKSYLKEDAISDGGRVYQYSVDIAFDDGHILTEDEFIDVLEKLGYNVLGATQEYSWDENEYYGF